MNLTGLHHVTAVTKNAKANLAFYTQILGMRLVKKTVNQDDVSAYHLFYADAVGSAGTDLTFFEWANIAAQQPGTGAIDMIALRVPDQAAIDYWVERFAAHGIDHDAPYLWMGNRPAVAFRDPEGQQLMLISDLGTPGGVPWDKADVPIAHAITGLFGTGITVRSRDQMELLYRDVFGFTFHHEMAHPTIPERTLLLFSAGEIAGGTLVVQIAPDLPPSRLGAGGVHHIAFRVPDVDAAMFWIERLRSVGLQPTTVIDRFYFQSVYTRVPGNILIEIATDGPGFAQDESLETMGQRLSLPPFLEGRRREIEAGLKPLA